MKQGIFLPPLPEAMTDLFFLICITSVHVLALYSVSFNLFSLLTIRLLDVGLGSSSRVQAKHY